MPKSYDEPVVKEAVLPPIYPGKARRLMPPPTRSTKTPSEPGGPIPFKQPGEKVEELRQPIPAEVLQRYRQDQRIIDDDQVFREFVDSLGIEPIQKVLDRLKKQRDSAEAVEYFQSKQYKNDATRSDLETGKLQLGYTAQPRYEFKPSDLRRSFGLENIINFYRDLAKKGSKTANAVGAFRRRVEATASIHRISRKLEGYPAYIIALDRAAAELGIQQNSKAASKLYALSDNAPNNVRFRLISAAVGLGPATIDHTRKTTKENPPLADLFRKSKGSLADFRDQVSKMSDPKKEDTYKDTLIKRIYKAFLRDLEKASIDTPAEFTGTSKDADKLIAEIELAARPAENLIRKIESYERKH